MKGLVDHQVVQRDGAGRATISVSGTSNGRASLAVVDAGGTPVVDWRPVGDGDEWAAAVDIRVGGPYDLVVRDDDGERVLVHDFLVGDVWLLGGQSNMQGVGRLDDEVEPPSPMVHVLDMKRRWRLAAEPLHRVFESPDLAHHVYEDPDVLAAARDADLRCGLGAGLGVAFGRTIAEATGVPVGLIAVAQGGSSLAAWSPARRHEGGDSLFGSMLLSVEAAGGAVAGMLWYQGESDAVECMSHDYAARLQSFVAAVRDAVRSPGMPFFHVQIGRLTGEPPEGADAHWMRVREAQRTVDTGAGGVTTAVDLGLSDVIHLSTASLRRLGRRLARLAMGDVHPITLGSVDVVAVSPVPAHERFEVRMRFNGVTGRLMPAEHVAGFSLRSADGTPSPCIYAADVDAADPSSVVLRCSGTVPPNLSLWYGWGLDPYCNLVDEADMAVPAFGPVPVT